MASSAAPPDAPRRQGALHHLAPERGIALPAVLLLLFAVATLGAAVVAASVSGTSQAARDRGVKRSVAAADAGLSTAVYRLNKLAPKALFCAVVGATGLETEPVQADGWCRTETEQLDSGVTYSYRVSAALDVTVNGQSLLQRKIVATGTANGAKRRAMAVVGSLTGRTLFGGYAVITLSDLTMPNSTRIDGNVGSNGNVSLTNTGTLCGNLTYGPGKTFSTENSGALCPGYVSGAATQPFVLNPVDQGNAATANDNGRIGLSGPDVVLDSPQTVWNSAARTLSLNNSSTLTLTGNVYSFCKLDINNNAQLIVAPRAPTAPPLKIYIDAPQNCPGVAGAGTVTLRNGSSISNLNTNPTTLELFVVGSSTTATSVNFENNFQEQIPMIIYAPQSTVLLQNHTSIIGAIAAKAVTLQNNTGVIYNGLIDNLTVDGLLPLFRRQTWLECATRQPGSAPDSGC
jgi:hypothetical protein